MPDGGFPPPRARGFATTRWSLVLAAGQKTDARSAEALAGLCEIYWYPVYAFIRRQGHRAEDCADLTQEFFARVVERNYLHGVDPARGRFRAFLCASIRHFLANERDRARALKRGGNQPPVSLDVEAAEGRYELEPRDHLTPEKLFDRHWALILLERALARLHDGQTSPAKRALFDHLKGFLTGDGGAPPYADVAKALGTTEGAIKVAVHRLRRQFRDALVEEIAETVSDPADIHAEIEYLLKAVSA
jgi:RNA polymerase sigma-70 factor (ECF subfamily)